MKKPFAITLVSLLLLFSVNVKSADTINTAKIITSAASASCINYRVVGACFWLVCSLWNCKIEPTIKVGHYNPDLVVSAQNGQANSPWVTANKIVGKVSESALSAILSPLGKIKAGSNQSQRAPQHRNKNLKFKASNAIGHPLTSIPIPYRCPSQATTLYPYFISGLDTVAWNLGLPEMLYPQALVPGMREIGSFPTYSWGAIYPRSGFLGQTSDAKTAAVIAQRVADIVTRTGQPHVYTSLISAGQSSSDSSSNMKTWPPGKIKERDGKTGKWQMLAPNMTKTCSVFGDNDLPTVAGWDGGKQAKTGSYAWTLWRPYSCCKVKKNGVFLFSVGTYP